MIDQARSLPGPTLSKYRAQNQYTDSTRKDVAQPAVLVSQAPVLLNYRRYLRLSVQRPNARCLAMMSLAFVLSKDRERPTRSDRSPPEGPASSHRAPVTKRVAAIPLRRSTELIWRNWSKRLEWSMWRQRITPCSTHLGRWKRQISALIKPEPNRAESKAGLAETT